LLSWGRLKSPLSPGVDQAASGSDSPLQFVMYLRNFCLYTNFSPPALIPSQPSRRLHSRFIPVSCPRHSALISFLMSGNYLRHLSMPLNLLTKMFLFYPIFYPIFIMTVYLFVTFSTYIICHATYISLFLYYFIYGKFFIFPLLKIILWFINIWTNNFFYFFNICKIIQNLKW